MKTPAPADLQRWSEELARNPASLAFLPLARAYRRLGRRDLATRLCLRGLEAHPANVEAHALLALLYLEAGDRARAADEWSIVLRLKPGNFEALRGMGFRYLEQNDTTRARQHLERAALIRPGDTTVQEALRLLRQRETALRPVVRPSAESTEVSSDAPAVTRPPSGPLPGPAEPPEAPEPLRRPAESGESDAAEPWAEIVPDAAEDVPELLLDEPWSNGSDETSGETREDNTAPAETQSSGAPAHERIEQTGAAAPPSDAATEPAVHRGPTPARWAPGAGEAPAPGTPVAGGDDDPTHVFDEVVRSGPVLGALLLDPRGLVLAGSMGKGAGARADDIAAILGAAVDEAARTASYLELGRWTGLLMEAEAAVVHVVPVTEGGVVVLAALPEAPTGWVMRASARAATLAARFLEVRT